METIELLEIQPNLDYENQCTKHLHSSSQAPIFRPQETETAGPKGQIIVLVPPDKGGDELIERLCRKCPIFKKGRCPGLDKIEEEYITVPKLGTTHLHRLNPGFTNLMRIYITNLPPSMEIPLQTVVRFKIANRKINAKLTYNGEIPKELDDRSGNDRNDTRMLEYMLEPSVRIRYTRDLARNLLNKTGEIIKTTGLHHRISSPGILIGDTSSRPLGNIASYTTEVPPNKNGSKNDYYVVAEILIGKDTGQKPSKFPHSRLN